MKYVPALSAGSYTAILYVMEIAWKGVGVHPPPSPARADFSMYGMYARNRPLPLYVLCGDKTQLQAMPCFRVLFAYTDRYSLGRPMDEGTKKPPIPICRLYWCFCLGWCNNFFGGSESGQKQSVILLQNMVYNTTQHPRPPPHSHTLSVYTVRFLL